MDKHQRIDLDKPLWNQDTFFGRAKHFFWVTDPRTVICSNRELDEAKHLLEQYRNATRFLGIVQVGVLCIAVIFKFVLIHTYRNHQRKKVQEKSSLGKEAPGTNREQIIYAKKLYESAFHPDSGERQNVFGRMSFQVPGGMAITGCMLQFYRTVPAVVFWQWVNQSFNALVNYTNRNAKSPLTPTQLGVAYVSATTSALVTALGFRKFLQKRASTFMQRYVPFAAVAAANCVNIPLMRQNELIHGIDVSDENGNVIGQSKLAAVKGITQVVTSRIAMAAPGMTILPVIMEKIEAYPWMQRVKPLHAPIQVMAVGCFLLVMTPVACALFPQRCCLSSMTLSLVEPEQWHKIQEKCNTLGLPRPSYVYFNKGL